MLKSKHLILFVIFAAAGCSGFKSQDATPPSINFEATAPTPTPVPSPLLKQDIAQMVITTAGAAPIVSKDDYLDGHVSILPNGTAALNAFEADMKIKGRGNFTWGLPKKPYKIKLATKTSVMGFPADKEWVLLANYVDRSLLRTVVAFEFSRRLGTEYTPRSDFVDLVLNGENLGSYTLTEQVKGGADRVKITEMKTTDIAGDALTGGYLVELNARLDEAVNFTTSRNVPYSLKEPSGAVSEQADYIKTYIQTAEDVLYSANFADPIEGYAKYIDVDSFINLYLIHELFKNKDAANFSSIFLFKERGQKLKMGPAWDFDLAAGMSDITQINDPIGWHLRTGSPLYSRLFQDPVFTAKVKTKWNAIKAAQIDTLDQYIDLYAFHLEISQQKNFDIWQILTTPQFPVINPPGSFNGEVSVLKSWLKTRANWMDQQLNLP